MHHRERRDPFESNDRHIARQRFSSAPAVTSITDRRAARQSRQRKEASRMIILSLRACSRGTPNAEIFNRPWRPEQHCDNLSLPRSARPRWADYKYGQREILMRLKMTALLAAGALVGFAGSVFAHHSFAMFDQEHPIDLVGTVKEFKFTSPHTFILLEVKETGKEPVVWNLEGASPSALVRDGWSSKTLPAGTELKMKIDPLRSGAPGGAWGVKHTKKKDGSAVVSH